ncbi:MAG: hypothetical protein IPG82_19520 [Saprospiraceae bacterium]|nr:hypothetical protein [Saprospiraceae bacterium]
MNSKEKQILHLLIEGNSTRKLEYPPLSKQTVDTHRKNMLRKHKLNNTGEPIGKAIKKWLVIESAS